MWQSTWGKWWLTHWASLLRWIWSISEYNLWLGTPRIEQNVGLFKSTIREFWFYLPMPYVSYPQLTAINWLFNETKTLIFNFIIHSLELPSSLYDLCISMGERKYSYIRQPSLKRPGHLSCWDFDGFSWGKNGQNRGLISLISNNEHDECLHSL